MVFQLDVAAFVVGPARCRAKNWLVVPVDFRDTFGVAASMVLSQVRGRHSLGPQASVEMQYDHGELPLDLQV